MRFFLNTSRGGEWEAGWWAWGGELNQGDRSSHSTNSQCEGLINDLDMFIICVIGRATWLLCQESMLLGKNVIHFYHFSIDVRDGKVLISKDY